MKRARISLWKDAEVSGSRVARTLATCRLPGPTQYTSLERTQGGHINYYPSRTLLFAWSMKLWAVINSAAQQGFVAYVQCLFQKVLTNSFSLFGGAFLCLRNLSTTSHYRERSIYPCFLFCRNYVFYLATKAHYGLNRDYMYSFTWKKL